ncbi:UNVERIFIED_CONTAM: hypothetical protein Slati_2173900 [Sesamum latifolium]|uniref:Retrotransposon gag protein n=1 Tax=Sesamum latifolium TaxID=2727402 RepID=A0AAW2WVE1_9LAMI
MHANAVGGLSGPSQRGYDHFSNTYNPGWRDHPNLRYGNQPQNFHRPPYQPPPPPPQTNPNSGMPLEDIVKTFAFNTQQFQQETHKFQQETRASIQNLESQVSQLASSISRSEFREHGKTGEKLEIFLKQAEKSNQVGKEHPKVFVPKPPFPERFAKAKKEEEEKESLETLCKAEENIPLLDAIKQVPRYAKFLKELCTNQTKLRGNERVSIGENVSTILQSKLPPKCKDPGTFSIPCKIGNIGIEKSMCNLGASINVMSLAIYESLNVDPLKEMGIVLQLADRSIVYPKEFLRMYLCKLMNWFFLLIFTCLI